jgi:cell division protease FtsH
MAYSMVTVYGMNKEIGNMSFFDSKQSDYTFNKPYSDATAQRIDEEVKKIIDKAYQRTKDLLIHHREHLDIIAKELLEKEILFQSDLERLIGKRPFAGQTTYEKFTNGTDKEKVEAVAETTAPIEPVADSVKE